MELMRSSAGARVNPIVPPRFVHWTTAMMLPSDPRTGRHSLRQHPYVPRAERTSASGERCRDQDGTADCNEILDERRRSVAPEGSRQACPERCATKSADHRSDRARDQAADQAAARSAEGCAAQGVRSRFALQIERAPCGFGVEGSLSVTSSPAARIVRNPRASRNSQKKPTMCHRHQASRNRRPNSLRAGAVIARRPATMPMAAVRM